LVAVLDKDVKLLSVRIVFFGCLVPLKRVIEAVHQLHYLITSLFHKALVFSFRNFKVGDQLFYLGKEHAIELNLKHLEKFVGHPLLKV